MIVPRNRLLVWTGLVVVPFGALGQMFPEIRTWCAATISALLTRLLLDAFSNGSTTAGVRRDCT